MSFGETLKHLTQLSTTKSTTDLISEIFDTRVSEQRSDIIATAKSERKDYKLFSDRHLTSAVTNRIPKDKTSCQIMEEYVNTVKTRDGMTLVFDPSKYFPQFDMGRYGAYDCRIGIKW